MKHFILVIMAFILSFFNYFWGKFDNLMILLLTLIGVDLILGVTIGLMGKSSKSKDGKYDYKVFIKNLCYKLIVLLMIPIGVICDNALNINVCRNSVILFYCGNEILSVIVNLGILGVPVPPIFQKLKKKWRVTVMQILQNPIRKPVLNAGYKNIFYYKKIGFTHYGWDLGSAIYDRNIYSPGDGEVVAMGMDGKTLKERMGNAIVIVFPQCYNKYTGKYQDVTCRMWHLDKISPNLKVGHKIKINEILGEYGNTGAYASGKHLHIEFDTDTEYAQYAYGVGDGGQVIKAGTIDSSINPCYFLNGEVMESNLYNSKEEIYIYNQKIEGEM